MSMYSCFSCRKCTNFENVVICPRVEVYSLRQYLGICLMIFQAEKVIKELHRTFPEDGLLPIYLNPLTGTKSGGAITFGAMGDR